ncbi:MAG: bactofilin family protein [Thermoanaerobaculia bacterium]
MALFGNKEKERPSSPLASPPASPSAGPAKTAARGSGGSTVIGSQIKLTGDVSGDEDVEIQGRVEGTINLKKNLVIATGGSVDAKVHAKNVTIAGKVKGDVTADERVELLASGSLEGNIRAPKIVISEGAHFRGSVDMSSARPEAAKPGEPPRPAVPGPLPGH